MKLTKQLKSAIVNAIMADTPVPDYEQFKRSVQDAMFDAMSPDVQRLYAVKPDALRETWQYFYGLRCSVTVICGDADVQAVLKPILAEEEQRENAKQKLVDALGGINTVKQFITAFPEFTKYAPVEHKTVKYLPALTDVVANLSKLGWPVGAAA